MALKDGEAKVRRPAATPLKLRRLASTPVATTDLQEVNKGEAMTTYVEEQASPRKETMRLSLEDLVELGVEELEEMIAPALMPNHNEALVVDLDVEELEEVIAPGTSQNHNESFVVDLEVEELEEVIAPGTQGNHNETLVSDAAK